jgi:hypothetical protein
MYYRPPQLLLTLRVSKLALVGFPSCNTLVLWVQIRVILESSRVSPESQVSSSECSLLEEQMQGRRPSYKEYATLPRVQRSTGVIDGELASGYVLVPSNGTFDLII